jgi:hypothetical protein
VGSVKVTARPALPARTEAVRLSVPLVRAPTRDEAEALIEESILADPERLAQLSEREQCLLEIKEVIRSSRGSDSGAGNEDGSGREETLQPLVSAGSPYWKGDRQYVNLVVRPLRYSKSRERLIFYPKIEVKLDCFGQDTGLPLVPKNCYRRQYELVKAPVFKTEVSADGIYLISYSALQAAGFPLTGDPRNLKFYHRGREIAVHLEGEADGFWDPGDYLEFYGREDTGFYTQTHVYWLEQTLTPGKRMPVVDVSPSGTPPLLDSFLCSVPLEEDRMYYVNKPPQEKNDYWFWNFAGPGWAAATDFDLPDPSSAGGDTPFEGWFFGITEDQYVDPDHHTRLYLNDQLIADFTWDGKEPYHLETAVPPGYFNDGPNNLRLEEVGDTGALYDYIYLNRYLLSYHRRFNAHADRLCFATRKAGDYLVSGFTGSDILLFDVNRENRPRRMVNFAVEGTGPYSLRFHKKGFKERQYLALLQAGLPTAPVFPHTPCDLTTYRRANYIAVIPPEFSAAIQPLLDYRDAQGGIEVEKVDLREVYDTFSFGEFNPHAIRRFLRYAWYHWKTVSPVYALLVGDGCYDYRNRRGTGKANYIPPLLFASTYMQSPTDNRYACVAGKDHVPDLSIGRLCVTSAAETEQVARKIISYEEGSDGLEWQGKALLVADNPDIAGDFPADSTRLGDNYLSAFTRDTAYLPDLGVPATRTAIVDAFNSGRLVINYMGHGADDRWSSDNIFSVSTLSQLSNADRLPLLVTLTCLNGYWCDLNPCLAAAAAGGDGKGSIASFSPSGMCSNINSNALASYFYEGLFSGGERRIGPAVTDAKARLGGISSSLDTMDLYHIFGDPALTLKK